MACMSRPFISLRIAVPYIGKIPAFDSVVELSRFVLSREECDLFQIITQPPGSKGTICYHHADVIVRQGATLMFRKRLHSKIYQFTFPEGDRAAFVGSANLTRGGFKYNDETVALFRDKSDNDAVEAELLRIESRGAYRFEHWKMNNKHTENLDHVDII